MHSSRASQLGMHMFPLYDALIYMCNSKINKQ